jgi:hypothetical protein
VNTFAPYSSRYRRIRSMMLDPPVVCAFCKTAQATTLDHDPPLAMHVHREGAKCCRLIPACTECNARGGELVRLGLWRPDGSFQSLEAERERDGLAADDPRWRVPWLEEFLDVPANAVWPRLMTVPHPRAAGSLGAEFSEWAEARSGHPLRWWQRLFAARALEVDAAGVLVWETVMLSLARQLGKSWLLRELCLWRIHQGDRFGEPQDCIHTGKDLAICKEVQRSARIWAKARSGVYKVREVNGQEEIERLEDGSRWMLRAREAVYGYSASLAAVDEAWKVKPHQVEEGLTPTMAERVQAQLLLVSTAHRMATALMLSRRKVALGDLELGEGDLLVEWSAPAGAELDDLEAWRLASPHWTPRRERLVQRQLELARAGEIEDPDEPDPEESFRAQWLNQWPNKISMPDGREEPLLPEGLWASLAEASPSKRGGIWLGVEDDYRAGAAVAAVAAMGDLERLRERHQIREVLVGASLMERVPIELSPPPQPAGQTQTRLGLALLRDLAAGRSIVHDQATEELDDAVASVRVREVMTGLQLVTRSGPTHLIKALVWAVGAAHKRQPVPAIF